MKHAKLVKPFQLRCCHAVLMGVLLCASMTCLAETYSYDAAGRITGVVYDDGSSLSYQYDNNGNRLTRTTTQASSNNGSGSSGGGGHHGGGSFDPLTLILTLLLVLVLTGVGRSPGKTMTTLPRT